MKLQNGYMLPEESYKHHLCHFACQMMQSSSIKYFSILHILADCRHFTISTLKHLGSLLGVYYSLIQTRYVTYLRRCLSSFTCGVNLVLTQVRRRRPVLSIGLYLDFKQSMKLIFVDLRLRTTYQNKTYKTLLQLLYNIILTFLPAPKTNMYVSF